MHLLKKRCLAVLKEVVRAMRIAKTTIFPVRWLLIPGILLYYNLIFRKRKRAAY
jgi:hypothetical protein